MSSEPLIRPGLSTSIKKNLPKIKAELRAKVPNVGLRDVQIRTLPYQEVLRNDLCLAVGCGSAALELFNDMTENDGRIFSTLKYHEINDDIRGAMERLVNSLSKAKEITTTSKMYLDLALHFGTTVYETFPWTTKALYEKALDTALNYNDIYQQILVQYHYANFLFSNNNKEERAAAAIKIQTALVLARSTNNDKWSRSENDELASLIKSVMLLYFKIFLQKARQMEDDKQEAQQIAMNVMAMIDDSLVMVDEAMAKARCFMEYGDFLQTNQLFLEAIDAYLSGMGLAKRVGDITLKCIGLFSIATCYKKIENMEKAEKYSMRLHDLAVDEEEGQETWKAEALLLLAEINMTTNIDNAIKYAEESFTLFLSLPSFPSQQQKLDQSRLIVGKLKAQKLNATILHHIQMIEEGSRPHFFSLLNWQISRRKLTDIHKTASK